MRPGHRGRDCRPRRPHRRRRDHGPRARLPGCLPVPLHRGGTPGRRGLRHRRLHGIQGRLRPWIADGAATGWGIWHEQGHHRQQRSVEPSEVVEVSVNIYSLAVEKAFGRTSRLVAEKVYDSALPKVGTSGVSYADSFDAFEKLVMLQQLTLQYGENFWPAVQKLVRSAPPRGADRWANLALVTSKVAAQDLTAFYRAWGVPLSAAAQQDIAALRLPPAPSTLSTRREP
ncbi:M60 family metallopeptidase [Kitasatospora sp. NPDC001574]